MRVCLASSSTMRLAWFGSRCGISAKAIPPSAGIAPMNRLNASSPPAEAPMATTGKSGRGALGAAAVASLCPATAGWTSRRFPAGAPFGCAPRAVRRACRDDLAEEVRRRREVPMDDRTPRWPRKSRPHIVILAPAKITPPAYRGQAGDGGNRHPGPRAIPRFTPRTPGASIARPPARTRDRERAASGGTMRRHMERQDPPPLVRPLHAPARMSDANAVQGTSAATPVALPRISNLRHRVPRSETRPEEDVLAVILTSGDGTPLEALTHWRCMAALPFAGLYRSIDFALSNCTNSGIRRVGVATQYKAHSLIQHLRDGWSRLWPGS